MQLLKHYLYTHIVSSVVQNFSAVDFSAWVAKVPVVCQDMEAQAALTEVTGNVLLINSIWPIIIISS